MNKGTVLALLLVVLGGGYGLGRLATRDKDSSSTGATAAMPAAQGPGDDKERVRVALEGPSRGPADAKVTIVEFSDFQCPFCSRVVPTVDKIMKDYPKDVRLFFRHNPLPFHPNAPLAAEAAVAAEAQGKFWEMHDKMFANQEKLERADLEKYAQADRPRHGQVQDRARHPRRQGARRRRPGGRQADRRPGDAELLHQRPQRAGGAAVRRVQEGDRRRDRARQQVAGQGDGPGHALRDVHEGGQGDRRRRLPRARARAPAPRSTRSPSATRRPAAASSRRSRSSSSPTSSARTAAASSPRSTR